MATGADGPVAIAVSGGSDSLSLMHFASRWSRQAGRELLVLTVDHGLRPEARGEADWVAGKAIALGHSSQVLRWDPDKRSQDAARRARHGLLAKAAREAGAECLLLGHTRSDVEETLLMRLSRPTALMAAVGPQPVSVSPVWPEGRGLLLGRPLIATSRVRLRAQLSEEGENWVEDPSNESDAYERVRIRKLIGQIDAARLSRITHEAMRLRATEDAALAEMAEARVEVDLSGLVEVDVRALPETPRLCVRFLSLLLQLGAGTDRTVPPAPLHELLDDIRAGGPDSRLTLGGSWLQRRGDRLLVGRDPGETRAIWQDGVWDGRYGAGDCETAPEDVPFLVRHAVPDTPWREIISGRLTLWIRALRLGAQLGAELAGLSDTIPVNASTTHPG